MTQKNRKAVVWAVLAAVSFVIAALSFLGVILSKDHSGRLIFGFAWSFIGLSWLGRYLVDMKKPAEHPPGEN